MRIAECGLRISKVGPLMEADLPLEVIEQRYSGEWVLIEETWDEQGNRT